MTAQRTGKSGLQTDWIRWVKDPVSQRKGNLNQVGNAV